MTTGGAKEPYTWDVHGSVVKAMQEVMDSKLLTIQERRLWNITLSALEILFAPATESKEAETKAWEDSPDGIAHAIASAVIEHQRLIKEALMDTERGGVWIAVHEQRGRIMELADRYREAVKE